DLKNSPRRTSERYNWPLAVGRRSFAGGLLAPLAAAPPADPADLTISEAIALLPQWKLTPIELPPRAGKQPLHGIPLALKDSYDTAGVRTTAASAHWRDRVPTTGAMAFQRPQAAGSVLA